MNPELAYPMAVAARDTVHGGKKNADKAHQTNGFLTMKVFGFQTALFGYLFASICSLCSKGKLLLQPLRFHTKDKKMLYTVAKKTSQKAK